MKSSLVAGSCNNTVRNGCTTGTANDDVVADTGTHYQWRCDGSKGGANSGTCKILKTSYIAGSCDNTGRNKCSAGTAMMLLLPTLIPTIVGAVMALVVALILPLVQIFKTSYVAGSCNNTVRNGCLSGVVNDSAVVDTSTHYKWRCDGTGGGANSATCQIIKTKEWFL